MVEADLIFEDQNNSIYIDNTQRHKILEEQLNDQINYRYHSKQCHKFSKSLTSLGHQDVVLPTALYNLKVNGYTEQGIFWLARELVMFNWSAGNPFCDIFLQG